MNIEDLLAEGKALYETGDVAGAADCFRKALAAAPRHVLAHYRLAWILQRQKDSEGAIAHYRAAVELEPSFCDALNNWGDVLLGQGDLSGAAELFRRAMRADASYVPAINNLATVALERGDVSEARRLYLQVADRAPGVADAPYNLALIALRQGEFEAGWQGYERRLECGLSTAPASVSGLPRLTPQTLGRARRVAIWKEQGVGDQLLFSTLLPQLAAEGIEAVIETDPRLLPAFRRSLPMLEFAAPDEFGRAVGRFDFQLPLGSLGMLFRNSHESFASQPDAVLVPDRARARSIVSSRDAGRVIGISWRSFQPQARRYVGHRKSIPLECFSALEDCRLLDLQYGDVDDERRAFDARHPGRRLEVEGLDRFNDLEGVLAAIDGCGLVVTTSNLTAHLAGAIGKRTWLVCLGANPPFHYWVPEPDGRSLWYPSVEIVTDRSWTRWEQAFDAIGARWKTEG